MNALAAAGTDTFTFSFAQVATPGIFIFRSFADGTCTVTESNETNNQSTVTQTVVGVGAISPAKWTLWAWGESVTFSALTNPASVNWPSGWPTNTVTGTQVYYSSSGTVTGLATCTVSSGSGAGVGTLTIASGSSSNVATITVLAVGIMSAEFQNDVTLSYLASGTIETLVGRPHWILNTREQPNTTLSYTASQAAPILFFATGGGNRA